MTSTPPPIQISVAGTRFNAGSHITVKLVAPPNGHAYALICGSPKKYPLTAVPHTETYSGLLPAPQTVSGLQCPVTAEYVDASGKATYVTYGSSLSIVPFPVVTDVEYEPEVEPEPTATPQPDHHDHHAMSSPSPSPAPTPVPIPPKPIYTRYPDPVSTPRPVQQEPARPIEQPPAPHPVEQQPAPQPRVDPPAPREPERQPTAPEPKSTHPPGE